jgi:hypothetical protein
VHEELYFSGCCHLTYYRNVDQCRDVGPRRRYLRDQAPDRGSSPLKAHQIGSELRKIALAGIACAALASAPTAGADIPGLTPFVGSWHAHEEALDIQPNANGRETYADKSTCPDAPAVGCGKTGTVDFTLTSVAGDTATGAITAASNPKDPSGGPVTIKLVGEGQGLQLWIAGGEQGFPFCNSNDNLDASHEYCGA